MLFLLVYNFIFDINIYFLNLWFIYKKRKKILYYYKNNYNNFIIDHKKLIINYNELNDQFKNLKIKDTFLFGIFNKIPNKIISPDLEIYYPLKSSILSITIRITGLFVIFLLLVCLCLT